MARSIPSSKKGVFSSCLWTGAAAFKLPEGQNNNYDFRVKFKPNGSVIPAMPDDILIHKEAVTDGIKFILNSSRHYLQSSMVKKYDVRTIPPKIDTKKWPDVADHINDIRNTTQNVVPLNLIDQNIGSNRGLLQIMYTIYTERSMNIEGATDKYCLINVDENIYWRVLKVSIFRFIVVIIYSLY